MNTPEINNPQELESRRNILQQLRDKLIQTFQGKLKAGTNAKQQIDTYVDGAVEDKIVDKTTETSNKRNRGIKRLTDLQRAVIESQADPDSQKHIDLNQVSAELVIGITEMAANSSGSNQSFYAQTAEVCRNFEEQGNLASLVLPLTRYLVKTNEGSNGGTNEGERRIRLAVEIFLAEASPIGRSANALNFVSQLMRVAGENYGLSDSFASSTLPNILAGLGLTSEEAEILGVNLPLDIDELTQASELTRNNAERERSRDTQAVQRFVSTYQTLERAIKEIDLTQIPSFQGLDGAEIVTKKRDWLYQFLEIDLDGLVVELNKAQNTIASDDAIAKKAAVEVRFAQLRDRYYASLASSDLPSDIQEIAKSYYDTFRSFFNYKQSRLKSWTDPDSMYGGYQIGYDLTEMFGYNGLNSSLVAFSFMESSNTEIKDIFFRYKTKSHLEAQDAKHPGQKDELIHKGNLLIRQHEAVDVVLADLKAFYLKQTRYMIKKESLPNSFQSSLHRINQLISNRAFTVGKLSFLGGSYRPNNDLGNITQHLQIVSNVKFEELLPGFVEHGFASIDYDVESPKLVSMEKLMVDFGKRMEHLSKVASESDQLISSLAKGDTDAFKKAAAIMGNDVFDSLPQEAHEIMFILPAYYQAWKLNIMRGNGQFRPSIYATSHEGSVGLEDLTMKRAWKTVFPEAGEDEIVVYEAIAKMMVVGMGDLTNELSNLLPPMDLRVDDVESHHHKIIAAVRNARSLAAPGEGDKAAAEALFGYMASVRPELKNVYYDEFARALLLQTNPLLHLYLWLDIAHEYKVNELVFGGAYNLAEAGIKGSFFERLGKYFSRGFLGAHDVMSGPIDILRHAKAEQQTFYTGMNDDILERRLDGKFTLAYRLNNLYSPIGITALNGWRNDFFDHRAFLDWFLKQKNTSSEVAGAANPTNREILSAQSTYFSVTDLKKIIDHAFQVGDQFAYLLVGFFEKDTEYSKFLDPKNKEAYVKFMRSYLYSLSYEYTPTNFIVRTDMKRFIHQNDKEFMGEWQKDIYQQISGSENEEGQALLQLISPSMRTSLTGKSVAGHELQEQMVQSKEISFLLLESTMALQDYIINTRNHHSLDTTSRLSLRQLLAELVSESSRADGQHSQNYNNTLSFFRTLKQEHLLEINLNEMVKVISTNLYRNLYGAEAFSFDGPAALNFSSPNGSLKEREVDPLALSKHLLGNNIPRGITDRLRYHNIGANGRSAREAKVDLFTFLHGLTTSEQKVTGPLFNLYYSNFALKEFVVFNPEYLGAKNSGKSLHGRMFDDFATKINGQKEMGEALKIIPKAVRATTAKELDTVEDEFLNQVNKAASVYEGLIWEGARHELASHLITQWLMMVKPGSENLRYLDTITLQRFTQSGKSLAELAYPRQSIMHGSTAARADYVRLRNFLLKAHQKGLLPMNIDGKEPVAVGAKVNTVYLKNQFAYIDKQLEAIEERIAALPPGQQASRRDLFNRNIFSKVHNFGNSYLKKVTYNDKYPSTVRRLYDWVGINPLKDTAQFGVYGLIFLFAILIVAIQQGMKELDSK